MSEPDDRYAGAGFELDVRSDPAPASALRTALAIPSSPIPLGYHPMREEKSAALGGSPSTAQCRCISVSSLFPRAAAAGGRFLRWRGEGASTQERTSALVGGSTGPPPPPLEASLCHNLQPLAHPP